MSSTAELASLQRAVKTLVEGVATDLKARPPLSEADRRLLKREIEGCIQALDELRTKVSG